MFSGATSGRRKKLVVSGIERDNFDAIEGLQRWCEVRGYLFFFPKSCADRSRIFSQKFGELRTITRMPNGDLHVDFKRTEVADTVSAVFHRRRAILSESDMGWL